MKFLLDTDHLSLLQKQSGQEYAALSARMALHPVTAFALCVVSFHEQVLGCHTYLTLLTRNVRDFGKVPGLVTED